MLYFHVRVQDRAGRWSGVATRRIEVAPGTGPSIAWTDSSTHPDPDAWWPVPDVSLSWQSSSPGDDPRRRRRRLVGARPLPRRRGQLERSSSPTPACGRRGTGHRRDGVDDPSRPEPLVRRARCLLLLVGDRHRGSRRLSLDARPERRHGPCGRHRGRTLRGSARSGRRGLVPARTWPRRAGAGGCDDPPGGARRHPWTDDDGARRHRAQGGTAKLRFRVTDPAPNGGSARVRIEIRSRRGRVVKAATLAGAKPLATGQVWKVRCRWARGVYTFKVRAWDAAGNRQVKAGSARLTVR